MKWLCSGAMFEIAIVVILGVLLFALDVAFDVIVARFLFG